MKKLNKSKKILYAILIFGFILRFYNYQNRWGLAYDQARDVLVSLFAINNNLIPATGPFSSAGQFVYGPQWFWIISFMSAIYPNAIITPWIIQTILYVFTIYVMFLIGKEIIGEKFGLLTAFFTAISISQTLQSTNLTSPSMVGVFSIFTTYFFIKYIKYSRNRDAFLLTFFIATTVNVHFQAVGLFGLIPIGFFLGKRKIKQIWLLILGFIIPFLPLLIFDLKTNFFESRNMLDYYLYGQQRIYFPRRWLTYAGVFWPKAWSEVLGGYPFVGYFITFFLVIFSFLAIVRRRINKELVGVIIALLFIILMLRYYKGELFGGYLVFANSFILILTAWVFYQFYKIKPFIFYILLLIIVVNNFSILLKNLNEATNITSQLAFKWTNQLVEKYPDKKFALYDYKDNFGNMTRPLSLYLYNANKIDDNGLRIGLVDSTPAAILKDQKKFPVIYEDLGQFQFIDLNASSDAQLKKHNWSFVNPSGVYKSLEEWYGN